MTDNTETEVNKCVTCDTEITSSNEVLNCTHCDTEITSSNEVLNCTHCNREICNSCSKRCSNCDALICSDCVTCCKDCGADICYVCAAVYNDNYYCEDCVQNCPECGDTVPYSEMRSCTYCDHIACIKCTESTFVTCDECGKLLCEDCARTCACTESTLCQRCHDACYGVYTCCEDTDLEADPTEEIVPSDEHITEYERYYAQNDSLTSKLRKGISIYCPPPTPEYERTIDFKAEEMRLQRYSLKPSNWPIFKESWENTILMGMEWELNMPENKQKDVMHVVQKHMSGSYIWKSDSSINPGMELVMAPRTLLSFRRINLKQMCKDLHDAGARGYSLNNCGIHIHVNKSAFPVENMRKIMAFFIRNKTFIRRFSKRDNNQLNAYANIPNNLRQWYEGQNNRHIAINRTSDTWEFRVFRSTTRYSRVKATLEFVDSIIAFTNETSFAASYDNKSLKRYLDFLKYKDQYQFLLKYILEEEGLLKGLIISKEPVKTDPFAECEKAHKECLSTF